METRDELRGRFLKAVGELAPELEIHEDRVADLLAFIYEVIVVFANVGGAVGLISVIRSLWRKEPKLVVEIAYQAGDGQVQRGTYTVELSDKLEADIRLHQPQGDQGVHVRLKSVPG